MKLVFDQPITYTPPGQAAVERRTRVWRDEATGADVCAVTEYPTDAGMSITNAAGHVLDAVDAAYGHVTVIEHYAHNGTMADTYDLVDRDKTGQVRWTHLPTAEARRTYPGIDQ